MQMKIVRLTIVSVTLLGLSAEAAHAALDSCSVSSSPVSFGAYDPLSATPLTSSGSVTVSCSLVSGVSLLVAYAIALSQGSGTFTTRTMHSGASVMNYNLYTTGTYTTVWGDGTGGTQTILDGYLLGLGPVALSYNVYGRIPANQNVAAGTYSDAITVTVTY
jgi:spore coat protein U-like protein